MDGYGVGDVGSVVLRDRKHLAEDGMIVVVVSRTSWTALWSLVRTSSPGAFVYVKESEGLMEELRRVAVTALERCCAEHCTDMVRRLRRIKTDLSNFLYKKTKRNPMILPVIMEVSSEVNQPTRSHVEAAAGGLVSSVTLWIGAAGICPSRRGIGRAAKSSSHNSVHKIECPPVELVHDAQGGLTEEGKIPWRRMMSPCPLARKSTAPPPGRRSDRSSSSGSMDQRTMGQPALVGRRHPAFQGRAEQKMVMAQDGLEQAPGPVHLGGKIYGAEPGRVRCGS